MNKKEFQLSVSETIEQYQVPSIDQGLTEAQVTERLETYGLNQLAIVAAAPFSLWKRSISE